MTKKSAIKNSGQASPYARMKSETRAALSSPRGKRDVLLEKGERHSDI